MMRHLCKTLWLAGIILLYCAIITQAQPKAGPLPTPVPVPAGGYYPMICRGASAASDAFIFVAVRTSNGRDMRKSITFNRKSETAPRGDYSKIRPGSCSWDDRTINDSEPQVIGLVISDYQWKLITKALTTPDQLWVFHVRLTKFIADPSKTYFQSSSHNALPPLSIGK